MFRAMLHLRSKSRAAPEPVAPVAPPEPLRIMDAREIAMHVVSSLRDAGARYLLTSDIDSTATAWCAIHDIEPIHPLRMREAVQTVPGVVYTRRSLSQPVFGAIRRALKTAGKKTDRQWIYEIVPPCIRVRGDPGPVPDQSQAIPAKNRTAQSQPGPRAVRQIEKIRRVA